MRQPEKTVLYAKATDDFAGTRIKTKEIDGSFQFIRNGALWKAAAFLLYYAIALPLVLLFLYSVYGLRIENKRAVRKLKGGFFLYGNHTHWSDGFLGHVVAGPKRTYVVAHADAVSIPGLRNIVTMLGAIPIPSDVKGLRRFIEAVKKRAGDGGCVTIYPEAHIWPYYTGIRPFPATSFAYPAELGLPVVAMTVTYRRRRGPLHIRKTPRHIVTVSDPIYAPAGLTVREAQRYYYQRVRDFMTDCAARADNYAYVHYEKAPEKAEA